MRFWFFSRLCSPPSTVHDLTDEQVYITSSPWAVLLPSWRLRTLTFQMEKETWQDLCIFGKRQKSAFLSPKSLANKPCPTFFSVLGCCKHLALKAG